MNDYFWYTKNESQPAFNATPGQSYKNSWSTLTNLSSEKVTIVIKCSGLLLIAMVGVFGNTLTLVAIRKTPSLWTKSNMLLVALTSVHLYMSAIQLPYFVAFNLWVYVFAENSCYYIKAIGGMYPVTKMLSHVVYCHFIVIAADRYIAIIYPLHYETKMTITVIKCLIGASYVIGAMITGIYASYLRFVDWSSCGIPYSAVMTATVDCFMYLAVALVTVFVYIHILIIALHHRSKISSLTVTGNVAIPRIWAITERVEIEKPKIKKNLKEFKATRMTAALVCAYTLPLIPYEIGRIMQACGNMQSYTVKLIDVGAALGNINIGLDWVIYGIMNGTFRRAYLRVLKIKTDADPNSE